MTHMLPETLLLSVKEMLAGHSGMPVEIVGSRAIGGGCINESFRLQTSAGVYFMKYNDARRYPGMFEAEAAGLALLQGNTNKPAASIASRQNEYQTDAQTIVREAANKESGSPAACASALRIPEVVGYHTDVRHSLLLLEFIETGNPGPGFWAAFGQGLAQLHRCTHQKFGLDHDNYIGSLPQSNRRHESWEEFFIIERLEAQYKLARDAGRVERDTGQQLQRLYSKLPGFFPAEPPALLHGDLWSGNFMVDNLGMAAVVDPAVYYGHRYMDLGMSKLFGGFSQTFYQAYHDAYPMEKNWIDSIEIANLYPLMVHVNLFDGGYLHSVKNILKRFA